MSQNIHLGVLLLFLTHVVSAQESSGSSDADVVPSLSPCCARINNRCQRAKKECYDYFKTPFLLLTCRCRWTIRQEYERSRKQCMRDAVEFFMEKLAEEDRRTIIAHLPGHNNRFPGKPATSGARGPNDRGKINLSDEYLKQKNQEYLEKQKAIERAMQDVDDVINDDVTVGDVGNVDRMDRDAIVDAVYSNIDPEIWLNSDENLIDNIAYMKA